MDKEKQLIERHYIKFSELGIFPTAYCFPQDVEKLEEQIAALKAEIKELRIEIESRKKDFLVARRESSERLDEIERKDRLIENALNQLYVDQDGMGSIKEARKLLEQALQTKEE